MKRLLLITFGVVQWAAVFPCVMAQEQGQSAAVCQEWNKHVDPALGTAGTQLDRLPPDDEAMVAINCLLKQRGNKNPARFSGATNLKTSQILPGATIELAALYYISYLFTGDWQHGDGVALWNRDGAVNPPGSVEAAYNAYTAWFKGVRAVGLSVARKRHLDPLKRTGLRWYGK